MWRFLARAARLFRRAPLAIVLSVPLGAVLSPGGGRMPRTPDWRLVWSDEFNGADGSLPDKTKWTYDIGGNGWGNHAIENYTARSANAGILNGSLLITARKEKITRADKGTR